MTRGEPRPNQREEARRRARLALLDAALSEFLAHGLDGASTRAIAARAGMSQASLFHHFASKQAIFDALVEYGAGHVAVDADAAGADPFGAIEDHVRGVCRLLTEQAAAARMFLFVSRAEASGSELAVASARRWADDVAQLLAAAQGRGQARRGDARALTVALLAALQGLAEVVAVDPGAPMPDPDWLLDIVRAPRDARTPDAP